MRLLCDRRRQVPNSGWDSASLSAPGPERPALGRAAATGGAMRGGGLGRRHTAPTAPRRRTFSRAQLRDGDFQPLANNARGDRPPRPRRCGGISETACGEPSVIHTTGCWMGPALVPRSAGHREKSPAAQIGNKDDIYSGGGHPTRACQDAK